jgi:hypothetical protein
VHYVGLDANQRQVDWPTGAVDWLMADLASSTAQWKIVFMKPDPAVTWQEQSGINAQFLMPIFQNGGVDLVLCGGNSPGFTRQVNGVWYQHAGMANGHGFFGLDISTEAINVTYYNKTGGAVSTYRIGAAPSPNLPPVAVANANPTTGGTMTGQLTWQG